MKNLISYAVLIFGVFALSTSAIFVKIANAPSAITAFYRLLFTLLLLLPVALLNRDRRSEFRSLNKKQWALSIASGLLLAIHYILWFESLNYTSVASSTVIVTLQPLFSILLGFCFLKERQNKIALVGCVVAILGSCVIGYGDFQAGGQALLGDLLALLAAAFISVYFFIGQLMRKNTSASVYSVLGYSGSVVFLAIYALLKQESFFAYSGTTWKCFFGLALISTVFGQFIFNLLLKWLPATTISMSILGEPVGTCILAFFILHESIGIQQGVGMVVILCGLTLYFLSATIEKRLQARTKIK